MCKVEFERLDPQSDQTSDTTIARANLTKKYLIDEAIEYLESLPEKDGSVSKPAADDTFRNTRITDVVGLTLPVTRSTHVDQVRKLLEDYATDPSDDKPLSIVIFGPPGSGKSFLVKQLSEKVARLHFSETINMTQINQSEEVAKALDMALDKTRAHNEALMDAEKPREYPVVFLDEFDTMRNGTPLGWLSWYLAPMEDGKYLSEGVEKPVGKAVFIFAGGTAETLDEFSRRAKLDAETYRARKVPDFISRLRGALDIAGINMHGDDRVIERAISLGFFLTGESAQTLGKIKPLKTILQHGYFVHGVRSLRTFIKATQSAGGLESLGTVMQRQHVSRGEFDGLTVGISAGLEKTDRSQQLTKALTEWLLQSGATIAYAGAFFPKGTLHELQDKAKKAPGDLVESDAHKPRIINYLGHPARTNADAIDHESFGVRKLDTMTTQELRTLGAPDASFFPAIAEKPTDYSAAYHAAWAISQFRLRVRVMQDVGALVVCGGKDDGISWGRMSGIAEETMIALALGKPVYVLGGAGGAAQAVGRLLGLADAPVALATCLVACTRPGLQDKLDEYGATFDIPGVADSPQTLDETRKFLFDHSVTTKVWPQNGLSVDENRQLYASDLTTDDDIKAAVALIVRGLDTVDWKIDR